MPLQVAPAELEALIRTHPDVLEAGVIGVPDQRSGELPKAYVVLKKGATAKPEDIKEFVKDKVAEFKRLEGKILPINFIQNCADFAPKERDRSRNPVLFSFVFLLLSDSAERIQFLRIGVIKMT